MRDASYLPWATHGKSGYVNGIRDDAPEWAKEAYAKVIKDWEEGVKNGNLIV